MALLSNISISSSIYLDGCGIIDVLSYFRRVMFPRNSNSDSNPVMSCFLYSEIQMALWNLFDVMWLVVFRVARCGLEMVD